MTARRHMVTRRKGNGESTSRTKPVHEQEPKPKQRPAHLAKRMGTLGDVLGLNHESDCDCIACRPWTS